MRKFSLFENTLEISSDDMVRKQFVCTFLKGGFGNQLFQFCHGYALSKILNWPLYLESRVGFWLDFKYRRKLEIDYIPFERLGLSSALYFSASRIPLIGSTMSELISGFKNSFYIKENPNYSFIDFNSIAEALSDSDSCFVEGYWHNFDYFVSCLAELRELIVLPIPKKDYWHEMAAKIQDAQSVALCIRFYEEARKPNIHSRGERIKTVADYNRVIDKIHKKVSSPQFFIFCTHLNPMLNEINLPDNSYFITHDNGFVGTLERLWLQSQCNHHIINNSSFYWWGAWMSEYINDKSGFIFAANNFLNPATPIKNWHLF